MTVERTKRIHTQKTQFWY